MRRSPALLLPLVLLGAACGKDDIPVLPDPLLNESQVELRDDMLRQLRVLTEDIGPRSVKHAEGLQRAADFIEEEWTAAGLRVERQSYDVHTVECHNLEVEIRGRSLPDEIVIVGAHYDSVAARDVPGANDNGTGTVAILSLARRFAEATPDRTLRFVAFANEEPPWFWGEDMGSLRYARRCKAREENVVAMLSLETMGYFTDEKDSQDYPSFIGWFYPDTGNFIAIVGNVGSRGLVKRCRRTFAANSPIPVESAALPSWVPGVGWSDQWSFWKQGYDAVMVTDTAPFRYPWYHTPGDTVDKLDMDRFTLTVDGIAAVVRKLVEAPEAR